MEQQANQIESSKFDQAVFADMKAGQQAISATQEKMNVDEVQDLMEDIKEAQANQEEVNDFFAD